LTSLNNGTWVSGGKPLIHTLHSRPMSGAAIEERSFEIIDREAPAHFFPRNSGRWCVA